MKKMMAFGKINGKKNRIMVMVIDKGCVAGYSRPWREVQSKEQTVAPVISKDEDITLFVRMVQKKGEK